MRRQANISSTDTTAIKHEFCQKTYREEKYHPADNVGSKGQVSPTYRQTEQMFPKLKRIGKKLDGKHELGR